MYKKNPNGSPGEVRGGKIKQLYYEKEVLSAKSEMLKFQKNKTSSGYLFLT